MDDLFARFVGNLSDRVGGSMSFRLLCQPAMAGFLAVRDGMRDGRAGRPAYGWALLTDPAHRRERLREGWRAVARVFILAVVVDGVYQIVELRWFYPLETLVVAFTLAFVPYVLIRGPVGRLTSALKRG